MLWRRRCYRHDYLAMDRGSQELLPSFRIVRASWARLVTPSLRKILRKWYLTVLALMNSRAAISRLVRCSASPPAKACCVRARQPRGVLPAHNRVFRTPGPANAYLISRHSYSAIGAEPGAGWA
jgi:hypothetical protein